MGLKDCKVSCARRGKIMKEKNLVIIMADQLRFDAFGKHTPNINRLNNEGVSFTNAYCASPLCVPARGAFFTGKYPNVTGSIINPWEQLDSQHGNVRAGNENLYTMLENKWDSWHAGKQHLYTEEKLDKSENTKTHWNILPDDYKVFLKKMDKRAPGGPEYQSLVPEMALGRVTRAKKYSIPKIGCYEEDFDYFYDGYIANAALDAIEKRDKSKPFLLNVMFLAPHPPFEIPEPWYSSITSVDLPDNVGRWYKDQSPLQLYNLTGAIGSTYRRSDWEDVWKVYLGLVSLLDHCVGMIIDKLKEQQIYDDTMIIFTSDHGEMLGSHCLWQKMCMYQEAVKTPLIIKFPKDFTPKINTIDEHVSAIDVLPTVCEYMEISKPENLSGLSLMPLIEGGAIDRDSIFIQFDGNGARGNFSRCVLNKEYKLIVDMFKDEIFFELYNIYDDPQEKNNLAFENEYRSTVRSMLTQLRVHMAVTEDLLQIPPDAYGIFLDLYSQFRS